MHFKDGTDAQEDPRKKHVPEKEIPSLTRCPFPAFRSAVEPN